MLYIVKRVTSVDPGVNGAPLSVTFESYFHKKYCLQFPRCTSDHDGAQPTFDPPLLDVYSPLKKKNLENGSENREAGSEWQKDSKTVSWREARKILRKLRRHMIGVTADEHDAYESMLHASKNEGRAL
jgi:hypothetical protein